MFAREYYGAPLVINGPSYCNQRAHDSADLSSSISNQRSKVPDSFLFGLPDFCNLWNVSYYSQKFASWVQIVWTGENGSDFKVGLAGRQQGHMLAKASHLANVRKILDKPTTCTKFDARMDQSPQAGNTDEIWRKIRKKIGKISQNFRIIWKNG